jgi:hypothetical protein
MSAVANSPYFIAVEIFRSTFVCLPLRYSALSGIGIGDIAVTQSLGLLINTG